MRLASLLLGVPDALDANVARQTRVPGLEGVAVSRNVSKSVAFQNT